MFKVQNKGTDSRAKGKIPPAKVNARTLAYWSALDLPVLIVRYLASSGDLYVRWAHGYSPDLRTRAKDVESRQVPFNASHKVDLRLGEKLLAELVTIRTLRSRAVTGPIPVEVRCGENTHGRSTAELRTALRSAFERAGRHLRLAREGDDQCATLNVTSKKISFVMPVGLSSFTLHVNSNEYKISDRYHELYPDILVAVGFALAKLGLSRQAVEFYHAARESSRLIYSAEIAEVFAAAYLELDHPGMAIRVAAPLLVSEDASMRAHAKSFTTEILFRRLTQLENDDTHFLLICLKKKAELDLEQLGTWDASRSWYLIGQLCGATARWQELLDAYDQALNLDGTYSTRPYFHREKAGALFHLGRYQDAAESYRVVVDDERVPDGRFLLVDALMHAGKYREALDAVRDNHNNDGPYAGRLALHDVALERVIQFTGVAEQERQSIENLSLDGVEVSAADLAGLLADHDALDPRLWVIVAVMEEEPLEKSFASAAVAAIVTLHVVELWLGVCQIGLETNQSKILIDACIDSAFRFCADDIPRALDEFEEKLSGDSGRALRAAVYQRGENQPSWPGQVFRLIQSDGSYQEIDLDL